MYPFLFLIIIYFYRYLYIIYNTLITTFDEGLNITYFLPHFSALTNFFKASANTSIRTMIMNYFFILRFLKHNFIQICIYLILKQKIFCFLIFLIQNVEYFIFTLYNRKKNKFYFIF